MSLKLNYYKAADSVQTLVLVKQSEYNSVAGLLGLNPIRLTAGKQPL